MTTSSSQGGDGQGGGPPEPQAPGAAPEAPALAIIEAFGGIRPMAKTLGLAVSTVQGWKERSAIPANRHDQIRAAARQHNIEIDPGVLRASSGEGGSAQPQVIEGQVVENKSSSAPGSGATPQDSAKDASPGKAADRTEPKSADKPGGGFQD